MRTDLPRDVQCSYLPAEKFPFTAPYTAEEMGLRSAEFPHSPYWNCTLIDIASTVTNTGFLDQRVTIIPIFYLPQGGVASLITHGMRERRNATKGKVGSVGFDSHAELSQDIHP